MIKFSTNAQRELKKAAKKVKKASKKVSNMVAPHKKIAIWLTGWVGRNFKSQGGLVGGWLPFALGGRVVSGGKGVRVTDITTRRSYRIDSSARLLRDTGMLEKSYHPFWTRNNAGVGSKIKYSKVHEGGLGPVPVRRTLPNIGEVGPKIVDIYEDYVKKSTKDLV